MKRIEILAFIFVALVAIFLISVFITVGYMTSDGNNLHYAFCMVIIIIFSFILLIYSLAELHKEHKAKKERIAKYGEFLRTVGLSEDYFDLIGKTACYSIDNNSNSNEIRKIEGISFTKEGVYCLKFSCNDGLFFDSVGSPEHGGKITCSPHSIVSVKIINVS